MTSRLIRKCDYCNATLPAQTYVCPSCGSTSYTEHIVSSNDNEEIYAQAANSISRAVNFPLLITLCVTICAIFAVTVMALNLTANATSSISTNAANHAPEPMMKTTSDKNSNALNIPVNSNANDPADPAIRNANNAEDPASYTKTAPPASNEPEVKLVSIESCPPSTKADGSIPSICTAGFYMYAGTLYYQDNGRWLACTGAAAPYNGWVYQETIPTDLGNNPVDYFVSCEYHEWFSDIYGASNVLDTPFFFDY